MAIDIPSGLKSSRVQSNEQSLKKIFVELKAVSDVGRVNSRLNCSHTQEAIPIWAGTHEDADSEKYQGFRADDKRFGQVIDPRYMRSPLLIAIGKFTIGIGAKAFQRNKKTNMVQLKPMVLGRLLSSIVYRNQNKGR